MKDPATCGSSGPLAPTTVAAEDVGPFLDLVRSALILERGADAAPLVGALSGASLRRAVNVNRLVPLMARWRDELIAAAPDREWLGAAEARHARRMLRTTRSVTEIQCALDATGVRALVLKGLPLGIRTTGSLTGRQFTDVDVLVDIADLDRAGGALEASGVRHRGPAHDSPLHGPYHRWVRWTMNHLQFRSDAGPAVELHWRLFAGDRMLPIDFDTLWRQRSTVATAGASCRTLGAVHELLFVGTHGAKHGFSRLHWLVDVVRLLRVTSDDTWHDVVDTAAAVGATRALAFAVTSAATLEPNHREVPLGRGDLRRLEQLTRLARPARGPLSSGGDQLRYARRLRRDPRYLVNLVAHTAVPGGMLASVQLRPPLAFASLPFRQLRPRRDVRRAPR